jgi:hypothetical protein
MDCHFTDLRHGVHQVWSKSPRAQLRLGSSKKLIFREGPDQAGYPTRSPAINFHDISSKLLMQQAETGNQHQTVMVRKPPNIHCQSAT